ncbi:MAG: GntR family transcriptional regulator [Oscillospiraceae bacterium]|jgi:DNA-binding transcriptional regulator YhcF (GntR family)|nr:GntR family transcriptional regulator [Oscillospiraceae bacterium]
MASAQERLYQRVTRALEDDILSGLIREGEPVPSTNQCAAYYNINPATAAKGIAQLTERGLLFKKRGLGMFVSEGARDILLADRRAAFRETYLEPLLAEARQLGVSKQDLVAILVSGEK